MDLQRRSPNDRHPAQGDLRPGTGSVLDRKIAGTNRFRAGRRARQQQNKDEPVLQLTLPSVTVSGAHLTGVYPMVRPLLKCLFILTLLLMTTPLQAREVDRTCFARADESINSAIERGEIPGAVLLAG